MRSAEREESCKSVTCEHLAEVIMHANFMREIQRWRQTPPIPPPTFMTCG